MAWGIRNDCGVRNDGVFAMTVAFARAVAFAMTERWVAVDFKCDTIKRKII